MVVERFGWEASCCPPVEAHYSQAVAVVVAAEAVVAVDWACLDCCWLEVLPFDLAAAAVAAAAAAAAAVEVDSFVGYDLMIPVVVLNSTLRFGQDQCLSNAVILIQHQKIYH